MRRGVAYRSEKSPWNDRRIGRRGHCDPPDAIDHLAEQHFAGNLEPAPIIGRDAVDVLVQDHEVTFGVALEEGVFCDVGDSGTPGCLEVAGDFSEGVWEAVGALFVGDDGDALHEVGDRDQVVRYGDIDGSGRGAVAGDFVERSVFKGVDHDLVSLLMYVILRTGLKLGDFYRFHESCHDVACYYTQRSAGSFDSYLRD